MLPDDDLDGDLGTLELIIKCFLEGFCDNVEQ